MVQSGVSTPAGLRNTGKPEKPTVFPIGVFQKHAVTCQGGSISHKFFDEDAPLINREGTKVSSIAKVIKSLGIDRMPTPRMLKPLQTVSLGLGFDRKLPEGGGMVRQTLGMVEDRIINHTSLMGKHR